MSEETKIPQTVGEEEGYSRENVEVLNDYVREATKKGMLALSGFELEKKYPKAYELFRIYAGVKSNIEPGKPLDRDTCLSVLLYTPRTILWDFFDENKIFINITGSETSWKYTINSDSHTYQDVSRRVLAEAEAYEMAFQLLENK